MIPITRKDHYLNEIVGWGDNAPEKPYIEEEFFFAEILGEAVQAPEPLPRYQMYLAKIAGRDIEIPTPITRLEYFLAKAAGMDITVPVPITREEIYWSNYTAIVEFEVENVPPLTYKAIEGTLKNYRIYGNTETKTRSYSGSAPLNFPIVDGSVSNYKIYGNTVNGESVGEKTANLFDSNINVISGYLGDNGILKPAKETSQITFDYIPIISGTYTFTYTIPSVFFGELWFGVCTYDESRTFQSRLVSEYSGTAAFTIPDTTKYIRISLRGYNKTPIIMLNEGSTTLPYEPYGFKIPITNNSETSNIYLDEPLTKSGNNADYIDYAEQKRYNADGTSEDITLPALPSQSSSNSLSVGTAVQPSSLAVDVDEVVSCGDKVTDSQSVNYGKYKIHVTLTADSTETTDIYLDEPLAKSGNNTDYIDYATQKRHNSDGTSADVELPALPTLSGVNTLTVGTEVQPSKVYIKGEKEREYS